MRNAFDVVACKSLTVRVRRRLSSIDVIDVLTDPFIAGGIAGELRSDNCPKFAAEAVR